jgi:hypothetical protein
MPYPACLASAAESRGRDAVIGTHAMSRERVVRLEDAGRHDGLHGAALFGGTGSDADAVTVPDVPASGQSEEIPSQDLCRLDTSCTQMRM